METDEITLGEFIAVDCRIKVPWIFHPRKRSVVEDILSKPLNGTLETDLSKLQKIGIFTAKQVQNILALHESVDFSSESDYWLGGEFATINPQTGTPFSFPEEKYTPPPRPQQTEQQKHLDNLRKNYTPEPWT